MNVFYINARKDQDKWRIVLNDVLMVESRRITTMKQIEEFKFGDRAIVLLNDTFPDCYKALLALINREESMTVLAMTHLSLQPNLPVSDNKKIVFIRMPLSEKAMKQRILEALGRKQGEDGSYFWGESRKMLEMKRILLSQKWNKLPIHLRGEIGTGKSQLAEWIADETGLRDRFVSVNCSSLGSDNLGMDTLFGHIEGAYTDGRKKRTGLIGKADGGILFLDEVQDLPDAAKSNLLTVLETGRYRPLGTDKEETSHFRLITASSASRDELYQRLGPALMSRIEGITLSIPPLRDRTEDIPHLIKLLEEKITPAGRQYEIDDLSPWMRYRWPHNIRELLYKLEYYGSSGMLPEEMIS